MLLQWNRHVNGTTFQNGLRFQIGLNSLRVSCKRALKHTTTNPGEVPQKQSATELMNDTWCSSSADNGLVDITFVK